MPRYLESVPPGGPRPWHLTSDERARALEQALDLAVLAPSVHNTQPWLFELRPDFMAIRADRSRQLSAVDPRGRELAQSVGAALLNARVALAERGVRAEVQRLPDLGDLDLLAVIRLVPGVRDQSLAALAPAIPHRHTNRRSFADARVPDDVLRRLVHASSAEETRLVPVLTEAHRTLVARLTQQADGMQDADPAYRVELRRWTTRRSQDRDGVPPAAVPHADGARDDDLPVRNFDTEGTGALPADTHSHIHQPLVLLSTHTDDQLAWLRSGEALERVLLELTLLGWVASPLTQPIEVPLTRTQLRSSLTWDSHPQMLLRIGLAAPTPATPRRLRDDVVTRA